LLACQAVANALPASARGKKNLVPYHAAFRYAETFEEVQQMNKELLIRVHPDKHNAAARMVATRAFQFLRQSFEELKKAMGPKPTPP